MNLFNFFKRIFGKEDMPQIDIADNDETVTDLEELNQKVDEIQTFKSENVIFTKLNYLEQYIKVFSLMFPDKYNEYLEKIKSLKEDYTKELEQFKKGISGNITFSIDPEYESKRYIDVIDLENDINNFIINEVEYKDCKDKFAKLCCKLNVFYNTIIGTNIQKEKIIKQLNNAYNSLELLVKGLREKEFFCKDSRKKDDILNYVIYSDYIIFKSAVREGIISDFLEYKQEISRISSLFDSIHYDNLVFNFFIESLENLQILITDNRNIDKLLDLALKESQYLERELQNNTESFCGYDFLKKVLNLENTVYRIINSNNISFKFDISKIIKFDDNSKEIISVNGIAKSILSFVGNSKADMLGQVMSKFSFEISWREFYFLSKIFELTEDIIQASQNAVSCGIKEKFLKLSTEYSEYTDEYIHEEKIRILNYVGNKPKKYILLFEEPAKDILSSFLMILDELYLDYKVNNNAVYLNHSYFNGFKNLEENFGKEIII